MATDSVVWTDDEAKLILNVTLEYKTTKASEGLDWEGIRSKYADILERFREHLPHELEDERGSGKEYKHTKEQVTKTALTSKLKAIRTKYRQAVDSGH
jgi:hypothetical protein